MHICFALKPARRVFTPAGVATEDLIHDKTHHGPIKERETDNGNDEAKTNNGNNEDVTGNGGNKKRAKTASG